METIFDWVANLGEAYGSLFAAYARTAYWLCLAMALLWLFRCLLFRQRLTIRDWLFPLAALLAIAGFLRYIPLKDASWSPYRITTEWFLVPALVLALVGAFLSRAKKIDPAEPATKTFNRSDWFWLIGLLLLGLLLRVYRLSDLPRGFHNEYADGAAYAIRVLLTGKPYVVYAFQAPDWQYMHFLRNPYLFFSDAWAIAFVLFGTTMTVYRGVAVFIGMGFLATFYAYVRREFGTVEARIATILATISVWCLALSRDGWAHLMFSPLLLVALLLIWGQALRTAKWSWYAIGTFLLAISLYGYRANYVFPLLVLGRIAFVALRDGKNFWRRHWTRLAASAVVFLIATIPFIHYVLVHKYFALITSQAVWGGDPTVTGANSWIKLWKKLLILFGDETLYARSGQGWRMAMVPAIGGHSGWLFNPLTSMLALLGLAVSLRRVRDERHFIVLLVLLLAPAPGLLSHVVARRIVLLTVPIFVLAGIGAGWLLKCLRAGMPERCKRLPMLLLGVSLSITLALNAAGFRKVLNARSYTEMHPIAEWTAKLIDRNYVYVVVHQANAREYLQFATYSKTGKRFNEAWQLLACPHVNGRTVLHSTGGRPAVFLLQWSPKIEKLETQLAFWERAQRQLPEMTVRVLPLYPEPQPFLNTLLLALKVPETNVSHMPALLERFYRAPQLTR